MTQKNAGIYGINRERTFLVIQKLGYNFRVRTPQITLKKNFALKKMLKNKKQGGSLYFFIKKNIDFLKNNRTYRGVRHRKLLPVRGQRSHTNAKTNQIKFKKLLQAKIARQRKSQEQAKAKAKKK